MATITITMNADGSVSDTKTGSTKASFDTVEEREAEVQRRVTDYKKTMRRMGKGRRTSRDRIHVVGEAGAALVAAPVRKEDA
jgi:hypothetical protein